MPDPQEVRFRLEAALSRLLENDRYLLEQNLSERSISHRCAEHLQGVFPEWHVDCEYNRNFEQVKRLEIGVPDTSPGETEARTVYPDIIVHRRGTDENLLVVEVKKSNNQDSGGYDLRKLEEFQRGEFGYENAYFVMVDVDEIRCEFCEWQEAV